ncbi:MAG: hypothetical protein U0842_27270 [Candidatus Binatia bacterium]
MSRPRTTPLARDDSPAAMMAAGVPGEDDDLDLLGSSARVARHRRRAPGGARTKPVVKHRPAPPTGRQVEPQCPTDATGAWPALRMPVLPLLDVRRAATRPLAKRADEAAPPQTLGKRLEPGLTFADFLSRLPDRLAAADLRAAADTIAKARLGGRGVVLAMGAHAIAAGLSPLIVDLMERGVITAVALDGAALVRDLELAVAGRTSTDTERTQGRAPVARAVADILGRLAHEASSADEGLGLAVGRHVAASRHPHRALGIAAAGARLGIPVTAHVAIGTHVAHLQPSADGGAIGAATTNDFQRFVSVVAGLAGGVHVSLGSEGQLSETLAAALEIARSLGHPVRPLVTIEIDVARPQGANALAAPTTAAGRALQLTGHHELLFPLLAAAVLERIAASPARRR